MTIVLLADGFEEIEALTPVDLLRRAGQEVKTVGITGKNVTGSHGITVVADAVPSEIDLTNVKLAVFPGGMPGSLNLDASPYTDEVIRAVVKNGGRLAAICAAPLVFGRRGLLDGKYATCFPGFEKELRGALISSKAVVTDGMVTTANGMLSAMKFAEELVRLTTPQKADESEAPEQDTEQEVIDDPEAQSIKDMIADTLENFNVKARINLNATGPRIYQFAITPGKGVKASSVTRLFDDMQLNLGVEGMRMESPIPGKSAIGVEIPKKKADSVNLCDIFNEPEFSEKSNTSFPVGKSVYGETVYADLTKLPHLIVGGATGMGKNVFINSMILSLAKKNDPAELKMILIDPKRVEYGIYSKLPHLLFPVITDVSNAVGAFRWAVEEMERRYDILETASARNISDYNEKVRENPSVGGLMPRIAIVVDELCDLMMMAKNDIECLIMSIAQKARAAGIHLIISTQRPSADVITGVIKANIPSRISCKVASYKDSKIILEQAGAEKLLNNGDMLYLSATQPAPTRVQSAFMSTSELIKEIDLLTELHGEPVLATIPVAEPVSVSSSSSDEDEDEEIFADKLFIDALQVAVKSGKISTSLLQRKLCIGYSKAAKFLDYMMDFGIVSEPNGSKPRDVLITEEELKEFLKKHV